MPSWVLPASLSLQALWDRRAEGAGRVCYCSWTNAPFRGSILFCVEQIKIFSEAFSGWSANNVSGLCRTSSFSWGCLFLRQTWKQWAKRPHGRLWLGQRLPALVEIRGTRVRIRLDQKRSASEIEAKNLYWCVWGMATFCCTCVSRMSFQLGIVGRRDGYKYARLDCHDNKGHFVFLSCLYTLVRVFWAQKIFSELVSKKCRGDWLWLPMHTMSKPLKFGYETLLNYWKAFFC